MIRTTLTRDRLCLRNTTCRHRALAALAWLVAACNEPAAATAPDVEAGGKADDASSTAPRLEGVADLHLHMFAEHAFGGGWLHGRHDGPIEQALEPCDGGEPGDHARLQGNLRPMLSPTTCEGMDLVSLSLKVPLVGAIALGGGGRVGEMVGKLPGTKGDTGEHEDRATGFPDFRGWPRWDSIAHQQAWEGHLEQAWKAGLRLEVVSAMSFAWLCDALPDENVVRPECDEMVDVFLQLEAAHAFAERTEWAEIALTSADARRIIAQGRLALVLSVEASHILGTDDDWRPEFEKLYAMGVRTLQPVHHLDSRFAGAAPHNTIFQVAQYVENCHIDYDCGLTSSSVTLGFDVDAECKNVVGLKPDGRDLVETMIDRGMLVDAAHLSERSLEDLYEILQDHAYYPFYLSHGHFREIMLPSKALEEKTSPSWVADMLRQTGGMFGLRTGPDEVNDYLPSAVENTCHGSSRSFAQAYDYGRMGLRVDMGLGADFNGFIAQTRPRFGPDACSASFPEEQACQAELERTDSAPPLGTDFDEIGLGHTGVLIDLLDDLDQLGSDTSALRSSADTFVRMWERAEGERSGPAASPLSLTPQDIARDIEIQPSHDEREDEDCAR